MPNTLVSIVIPTKNESHNIVRLLKSITAQSYKHIETIVVDDGSTDNTVALARKHGAKVYARVHLERSVQRNFGAKQSQGQYLVFIDADMELSRRVIEDCIEVAAKEYVKAVTIPEKTVGSGFLSRVRAFERAMYMGDESVEVARFFDRKVFFEFKGYDEELTGPEDYDLPYRISKKYKIARATEYILHHEQNPSLSRLLYKKYYYAKQGASYAKKHPELVKTQGNLLFRKAYITHWKSFFKEPVLGVSFIIVRILEALSATIGFISAVGIWQFIKTFISIFRK